MRHSFHGFLSALLLLTIAFCAPLAARADVGDHQFSYGYDIDGESAVSVLGAIYSTGGLWSPTDFGGGLLTPVNVMGGDVFLTKHDANGAHVFSLQFTPTGSVSMDAIATDDAGNVFLVGTLYGGGGGLGADELGRRAPGSIDFGGGPITADGEFFLAGFDADGNHRFSTVVGQGFVQDAAAEAGVLAVTGYSYGSLDFGGGEIANAGNADGFVGVVDLTGAHVWSLGFGDASGQGGMAIDVSSAGETVLAATTLSTLDFGGGPLVPSSKGLCLVEFDATGAHTWSQIHEGSFSSGGGILSTVDVAISNNDGGVVIVGELHASVDFGGGALTSNGNGDVFLLRLDTNGGHQWSQNHGGTQTDYAMGVALDASDNVFVTGLFASDDCGFGGALLSPNSLYADFFTAFYDANGVHQWSANFGKDFGQYAIDAGTFASGRLVATGGASSGQDFGGGTLATSRLFHVGFEGVEVATSAAPSRRSVALREATPNPFNPVTTIGFRLSSSQSVELAIFDAKGRRVRTLVRGALQAGDHEVVWNGKDESGRAAATGTYFYRLLTAGGSATRKMTLLK